jgi:hypothetical protein
MNDRFSIVFLGFVAKKRRKMLFFHVNGFPGRGRATQNKAKAWVRCVNHCTGPSRVQPFSPVKNRPYRTLRRTGAQQRISAGHRVIWPDRQASLFLANIL